jgi:hypothetical protein
VPVFAVNAQGQLTSVTNTSIAISGAAVSGNISGQAGSVANALTAGTYLTSGGTYDGSVARTFAVDATSANTASKVVARDASGDFSAGTITATLSGSATSATTATNLAGGAANQIPYQTGAGSTSFTVAPSASNQVLNWNGSAFTWSAGTISGIPLGSNLNALTAGTYLTSGGTYDGSTARTFAVDATDANTASKVVARDASGNFSAGTITATLNGNATNVTGTVAIANGGTGQTTANAAFNALAPSQTGNNGKYLTTDGTNTSWATAAASITVTNDVATATDIYPLLGTITSGTLTAVNTSNANLLYTPSTGELKADEMNAMNGIFVNSATVTANYTIPSGSNAMSAGPVTVNSGVTVTVSGGSVWTVI